MSGVPALPVMPARRPFVLLVGGLACGPDNYRALRRHVDAHGYTPRYLPLPKYGFSSTRRDAEAVKAEVDRLYAATGERIPIIAHSKGGLAVLRYLHQEGTEKVSQVIALGTPWGGVGLWEMSAAQVGVYNLARKGLVARDTSGEAPAAPMVARRALRVPPGIRDLWRHSSAIKGVPQALEDVARGAEMVNPDLRIVNVAGNLGRERIGDGVVSRRSARTADRQGGLVVPVVVHGRNGTHGGITSDLPTLDAVFETWLPRPGRSTEVLPPRLPA